MSFRRCIEGKVEAGDLDRARADAALTLFDGLEAKNRGNMNAHEAARRAAEETAEALAFEAARKRRIAGLSAAARGRIEDDLGKFTGGRDKAGRDIAATVALFDRDPRAPFSSLVSRREAVRAIAFGQMEDILKRFKRDLAGRRPDPAGQQAMVDEVFGRNTGDIAAREMAKAWADTAEMLRLRANAGGMAIPKRTDWGLPQTHDMLRVRQAGFERWRAQVLPRLDIEKMVDQSTGLPFTRESLEPVLREVYDTIATEGFSKVTPSDAGGGRALANRRADHRFLAFKDSRAWREYQEMFGRGEVIDVMIGHIDGMARDIASLEILGPNPRATLRFLQERNVKTGTEADAGSANLTERRANQARSTNALIENLFDDHTGTLNVPVSSAIANVLSGTRNVLTSMKLGSAALSALSDAGFQRVASRMIGMPQMRVLQRQISLLNPANLADRALARRMGLIADTLTQRSSAQMRFLGEVYGPEVTQRMADGVLRASGLSAWTDAGRQAIQLETMGFVTELAERRIGDLPEELGRMFEARGITSEIWDAIRSTAPADFDGMALIRPDDIAARTDLTPGTADRVATKWLEFLQFQSALAVPTASARGRVTFTGGTRPGTLVGEMVRSALLWKNFGVSVAFLHGLQALSFGPWGAARYAGTLMVTGGLFGALSIQMKQIAQGKDPRPMNDIRFAGAALLQGGGMGIFGDFLFDDVNRFGDSLAGTLAGPVVQAADDLRRITLGNLIEAAQGEDTKVGAEIVRALKQYTPGGSLWQIRLAYERLIIDQLEEQIDPDFRTRRRRTEQRLRRQFGQEFFFRPGTTGAQRPPDLANALAAPPS